MKTETKYIDITFVVEFFSNWHCGSGQAAGADVDALVVKDKDGLPYVPGRTLKGLLREAAIVLSYSSALIDNIFGISGDTDKGGKKTRLGCAFFGNATFTDEEHDAIVHNKWTSHLFQTFSSTAIDENGIAKDKSLRKIETVVPCKLQGVIGNVPENCVGLLEESMHFVKRMGTGRNRGYGRCQITITGKEEVK